MKIEDVTNPGCSLNEDFPTNIRLHEFGSNAFAGKHRVGKTVNDCGCGNCYKATVGWFEKAVAL